MKAYAGSFALYRQSKPTKRWKVPGVPEFDPNWVVAFTMPPQPRRREMAVGYPICDDCRAVPENPAEKRPNCECVKRVRKWAEERLRTETHLLHVGEIEKLQDLRRPKRVADPKEVLEMYLARGPEDRRQRVNSLKGWYEQRTGGELSIVKEGEVLKVRTDLGWDFVNRSNFLDWAEMRQEAGRRGWLGLGRGKNMPAGGWEQLRTLKAAGRLKGLDKRTACAWNTTILGYLTNIKSIFGEDSRQHVLRELTLPDLKEFLATSLDLETPKGHKYLRPEQLQALLEGADELKKTNLRKWVVNQLLMRLACRPEEVEAARPSWLEVAKDKGRNRTRIVIISRPEEGFILKAGSRGKPRRIWLPPDLVAAIKEVATEKSLIGAKHITEARELVRYEHSRWLRETAKLDGTQTNYLLRHLGGAERMTSEGAGAASALLGNTEALIHSTYGQHLATLEPVDDGELLRRLVE
jgi:hypothetical protein